MQEIAREFNESLVVVEEMKKQKMRASGKLAKEGKLEALPPIDSGIFSTMRSPRSYNSSMRPMSAQTAVGRTGQKTSM